MTKNTEETPKILIDKVVVIAAQVIGLIIIGFATFNFYIMYGRLSLFAVITVNLIFIIPGYFLVIKRKSGCVMFLVFSAIYPLVRFENVLTGGDSLNGVRLFLSLMELIVFSATWILGLVIFIKKRHLFA